jgi:TonB family protein
MTRSGACLALVLLACGPGAVSPQRTAGPPPRLPVNNLDSLPPLGPEPEAPASPQRPWLDAVHMAFHPRWSESFLEQARTYLPATDPLNTMSLEVTLRMVVGVDGEVRELAVERPSGVPGFDDAAKEVVHDVRVLPRPTDAVLSDDGKVYLDWRFARDARREGVAGARVDRKLWPPARAVPRLIAAGRFVEAAQRFVDLPAPDATDVGLARDVAGAWLLAALADEKEPARRIAAAAELGRSGWAPARPTLRALARSAPDLALQTAAMAALAAQEDAQSVDLLAVALMRMDATSTAAARALAWLGHAEDVWRMVSPKLGTDARGRTWALAALADAAVPASVPALAGILADRKAQRADRTAAAHALGRLAEAPTSPATRALVDALGEPDAAVRAAAAAGLARLGPRPGATLYKVIAPLFKDRDPRVRGAAITAAAMRDPGQALKEAVGAAKAREAEVVVGAIAALAVTPGGEATAALAAIMDGHDEDERIASAQALAGRAVKGDGEAAAVLGRAAHDADPAVRAAAAMVPGNDVASGDKDPGVRALAMATRIRTAGATAALADSMRAFVGATAGEARDVVAAEFLGATR